MSITENNNNNNNNLANANMFNIDNLISQLRKCKYLPENIIIELIKKVNKTFFNLYNYKL